MVEKHNFTGNELGGCLNLKMSLLVFLNSRAHSETGRTSSLPYSSPSLEGKLGFRWKRVTQTVVATIFFCLGEVKLSR